MRGTSPNAQSVEQLFLEPKNGGRVLVQNRIIVCLQPGANLAPILEKSGTRFVEKLHLDNTFVLECDSNALKISDRIHGLPNVIWVEPDFIAEVQPDFLPNDPLFNKQWYLQNTGQYGGKVTGDLNVVPAWDISMGKKSVTVTIFDEGVSQGHPDIPLSPLSKNFVDNPPTTNVTPETDSSTHGTNCAGLAGATGNNGIGISGVAPNITILAVKVLDWPKRKFASSTSIANALFYAGEHSDIGSISVGVFNSNTVRAAITQLVNTGRNGKGYLLFKSSGNDNADAVDDPGDMAEVISVGSATDDGFRASYSNWGRAGTKTVDFLAPISGGPGWTTDLPGALGEDPTDYTWQFGGTSAATPLAAGVAALILSVNPNYTRAEVLDIMHSTCDKIGGVTYVNGVHPEYGYGQLNAGAALKKIPVGIRTQASFQKELAHGTILEMRKTDRSITYTLEIIEATAVHLEIIQPTTGKAYQICNQYLEKGRHAFTYDLPINQAGIYIYRFRAGKTSSLGGILLTQ